MTDEFVTGNGKFVVDDGKFVTDCGAWSGTPTCDCGGDQVGTTATVSFSGIDSSFPCCAEGDGTYTWDRYEEVDGHCNWWWAGPICASGLYQYWLLITDDGTGTLSCVVQLVRISDGALTDQWTATGGSVSMTCAAGVITGTASLPGYGGVHHCIGTASVAIT